MITFDSYFRLQRCNFSGMLCFHTRQHINQYRNETLGDSLPSLLKVWLCVHCRQFHYWAAGSRKQSGMLYCAGALELPVHVVKLALTEEWYQQVTEARKSL